MNTFNETKNCPKCNTKRFSMVDGEDLSKRTYICEHLEASEVVSEYLDVRCRVCGYIWKEKCFS